MRVPNKYSNEFRSDAVSLAQRGDRTIAAVANDLGMSHWTLRDWIKADWMARKKRGPASQTTPKSETVAERLARLESENAKLLRENERLKEDREILKKAAAFFAKESE
jgi:transposase